MALAIEQEQIDALAEAFGVESAPPAEGADAYRLDWTPRLNPVQRKVYECPVKFILAFGERGTGKSAAGLNKLVRHCVETENALGFIIVREIGQATDGGAWHKLNTDVLPAWRYGNYDRQLKRRVDAGMGIEYTAPKLDASSKKPYVWIRNRHGGWSMAMLISLFVGEHVEDKVKGKEPSFILVDEAQTTESDEYFTKLVQQLGRRQDVEGTQQIIYCANPKGPSHWLYQTFFVHTLENGEREEFAMDEETGHPMNPHTGEPVRAMAVFHVPIHENIQNLPAGYWDNVLMAVKNDPIEKARMVDGVWIDKPEGTAIFKEYWRDAVHLKGDALKNRGILPLAGHPLIVSWDPGAAHSSLHIEQCVPTASKSYWLLIDELNFVGRYMHYGRRDHAGRLTGLVPKVIERLRYWEERVGTSFRIIHVSDNSAFNQYRAKEGSFDVQDIEQISREYVKENGLPERFIIRMKACPKAPGSVEARVRIVTDHLIEETLLVSAICRGTQEMFYRLEEDKEDRMKPKRSRYIHVFDSASYGMLYFQAGRGKVRQKFEQAAIKPQFYTVG